MFKDLKIRWTIIVIILISASYLIWPTYKYYNLDEEQKNQIDPTTINKIRNNAINLGLDLQGGMYVLLEVDVPILVEKLANKKPQELLDIISLSEQKSIANITDFFDEFQRLSDQEGLRLIRYFSNLSNIRTNQGVIDAIKEERENAILSALEIIRNRIDEFGVSEPSIQRFGKNRIIVELAGVDDTNRARSLIQRTASLEFSLVLNNQLSNVLDKLDNFLLSSGKIISENIDKKEGITLDKIDKDSLSAEDLLLSEDLINDIGLEILTPIDVLKENPFSGYLRALPGGIGVIAQEYAIVNKYLENKEFLKKVPKEGKFLWGSKFEEAMIETNEVIEYRPLFYVSTSPEVKGGMIRDPKATVGTTGSDATGQWVVNLSMSPEGTKKWSRFTGANINQQVAIILDNKVFMAPVIRDKIPSGRTQITGFEDVNEAKDIANVLRAGELPAPVNIIEERTIGPSLGVDSVSSGKRAIILGMAAIMIFMLIYYNASGLLANFALILNILLIIAILSALNATLTLPGIAGLILTIGMAVDANVIIFERIREEIDIGKTVRSAIDSGYERAFLTILDANITTLIAAFVLAWIGSGPIKGFAVTLSAGIMCSMFTAVFVTRSIFMIFINRKPMKKLSI
tara:strand:- start:2601 stop:4490 length:1890 start_codon:yes stop_codon:yes gene_type:complete